MVPIVGCSGNIAEEKEKKEESEENRSPAKQVLVCDQVEPGEACVELSVEIVCKNDELKKSFVQDGKCVKLWVLFDISNRAKNAEVLRFNASKFGICKSS